MSRKLTDEEVREINSIFREYPDKVANIASYVFCRNTFCDGISNPFKGDLSVLKEARLSNPEDVRVVLNYVKRHINDGTFDFKEPLVKHYYISREDGKVKEIPYWMDLPFIDFKKHEIEKYAD